MHGGRSTGPRTPKGLERLRAARTIHGNDGAEPRARKRYRLTLMRRVRVTVAATDYQAHLPPAFVARLHGDAPELFPPPAPTGGITAAADRMRRRAVAAALAPWKQAIATARAAHLAARAAARLAKPHAPVGPRPPRDAGAAKPPAPIRRPADPAAATRANRPPAAPAASPPDATPGRRPTPPRPAPESPRATAAPKPRAPDRAPAPNNAGASKPRAPIPGRAEPAITPDLPNRAARRRWMRLQRRKHVGSAARALPTARG
jgi:hypothetical protein